MKTLKKLLKECQWMMDDVMDFMIGHYYADASKADKKLYRKGYKKIWLDLLKMRSQKDNFSINITFVKDEDDEWYDVHGVEDGSNEKWAIEMSDWRKWLGAPIHQAALDSLTDREILAHILWEMTFHGFSNEQVALKRKELSDLVKRVDSGQEPMREVQFDDEGNVDWSSLFDDDDDDGGVTI